MDKKKRSTVIGAALIITGLVVGLITGWAISPERDGTPLRPHRGGISARDQETEDRQAGPGQATALSFTAQDVKKAAVRYADDCNYRPDLEALVKQALDWDLTAAEPTVLIVHTHASESYTPTAEQSYTESSPYRTLNTEYNMVALGDRLTELLEQAGICVLHDRRIHDYPSYNSAYNNSRTAVEEYLRQYPSIQVVLDLHRDAVLLADGSQYAPTVEVDGAQTAQLMLVVGTDASGLEHPDWRENLAAALKLQILLEQAAPGITRPTILRAQRFNHDLSDGAMIVEVGTAGNTFAQAAAAIPILAQALIGLMNGAA